jgi:dTDP-4-dehydrorhamnose reductase
MEKQYLQCDYEVWGGIECTLNRVRDNYFDQLDLTGHYLRPDDIERLASLGIKKIRYPVLWEYHEPEQDTEIDWRWISRQLNLLRENNIIPIAGLVHHGSGPSFTSLEDPLFAEKLGSYASRVARQFPWLEYYTPVNEPLTTARFSGLYGLWYPHKTNDLAFLRMLLNEVKGIIFSMREIRKVNPNAKLIQTEDLGKTYSDTVLKYQADFENERRWLTFDFLCGRVNQDHKLWDYLLWAGLSVDELAFFEDNPCIPDIAGFNYYVTSERFLDKNYRNYPKHLWGGNHRHRYVDTEAIRVNHSFPSGLFILLKEAWQRFKIPMVITEAFLSCTEEEQVRWLYEICSEASRARKHGIDIRAVTFWALLGEFSWSKLVTSLDGEYASGAFDVSQKQPRETLIASFIKSLSSTGLFYPEGLPEEGWWKKIDRFHYNETCVEK